MTSEFLQFTTKSDLHEDAAKAAGCLVERKAAGTDLFIPPWQQPFEKRFGNRDWRAVLWLRSGNVRISFDIESQLPLRPVTGVIDADARTFHYFEVTSVSGISNEKIVAQQIMPVEVPVYMQGLAKQSWALGPALDVLYGFDCAQQHSGGMAFRFGDNVHAIMHAIDEIDVGMAWWTEHHLGPRGQAFRRMRGKVMNSKVRFDFNNSTYALDAVGGAHEPLAKQFPGNKDCIPVIK